jgi:hypothetical protein
MKLLAGGCSLIYGSEMPDDRLEILGEDGYSRLTYPALLAEHYNLEYQCVALPGAGNDTIARRILDTITDETSLVIVNWTYKDRFEFHYNDIGWQSLKNTNTAHLDRVSHLSRSFYSELTDTYSWHRYLQEIVCLQTVLTNKKIPFVFSSADRQIIINDVVHSNGDLELYNLIDFDRWVFWKNPKNGNTSTFIYWAQQSNYPVGPNLHPLEEAHRQSLDLFKEKIGTI